MKRNKKFESGIVLPLKEGFSKDDFGAVSVWVNSYLSNTKNKNIVIYCRKNSKNKYLSKNVNPIKVDQKIYTNINYIKNICTEIKKKKLKFIEIHNRPEYAIYISKNYPEVKVNLIFHNDPNKIRSSNSIKNKLLLLENCNKLIFVSKWVKSKFFEDLDIKHKNNTEIIYNFIRPLKIFPKKQKLIIFAGKLNKSKGYNIFGRSITKILDKFPEWRAEVYGNEERENYTFNHKNLIIKNWISHTDLLKKYEKASITVVNPSWEEPFGRTALESSSRGCAVITSISGGLSETFHNNLILKKNNINQLSKLLNELINNNSFLKKVQKHNFKNVIHTPFESVKKLDALRKENNFIKKDYPKSKIQKKYKVLHVANFGFKVDHRLFNISIANKITHGLIRNGNDVINFDYKNLNNRLFETKSVDKKILDIVKNYNPDLILLGHNNILNRSTLLILKDRFNCKISIWYEDHVMPGDPNFRNNLDLLEKNNDLIDHYFITTSPDIVKTKINKSKLSFLPIPVDPNIEYDKFYEYSKEKDIFFALSHGVNYGKLKANAKDERFKFVQKLISISKDKVNFHILGMFKEQPKWNSEFNKEIMISKTALNLSRGGPSKYCSSNRIATLMGNGLLPFRDEKVRYHDFFQNDEIITYKNEYDLISKLLNIKNDKNQLIKRSRNAKKSYFQYFENTIVAEFILFKIYQIRKKYRYIWEN